MSRYIFSSFFFLLTLRKVPRQIKEAQTSGVDWLFDRRVAVWAYAEGVCGLNIVWLYAEEERGGLGRDTLCLGSMVYMGGREGGRQGRVHM